MSSSKRTMGSLGPKLPNVAQLSAERRSLRCGCYLIKYISQHDPLKVYDGTLRVESHSNGRSASGDLYLRPAIEIHASQVPGIGILENRFVPAPEPLSHTGIPSFPIRHYSFYIRVIEILDPSDTLDAVIIKFEKYKYQESTKSWNNEGVFSSTTHWVTAPTGFLAPSDYLTGDVRDSNNIVVGRLCLGWVSSFLRKAVIELDAIDNAVPIPLDNGLNDDEKVTWESIFNEVGWEILIDDENNTHSEENTDSSEEILPSNPEEIKGWSEAELHKKLLEVRKHNTYLDYEWRYHLLAVQHLKTSSRGIMYDDQAFDSNDIPREGAALASGARFPEHEQVWGEAANKTLGSQTAAYFRVAVHEVAHAMGLGHNFADNGFMSTTDMIASRGDRILGFPKNITWSFSPEDQKRLKHYPDIAVRPGGIPLFQETGKESPVSSETAEIEIPDLELKVTPLLEVLPLGAPVRLEIQLTNTGNNIILVPEDLSLRAGYSRGIVLDSSNNQKSFLPHCKCLDKSPSHPLEPEGSIFGSMTLLRGVEGALFSTVGLHKIIIKITWDVRGTKQTITGETHVLITPATETEHAKLALKFLTTPNIFLVLVIGTDENCSDDSEKIDRKRRTVDIIQEAAENHKSCLQPHYAWTEVKRRAYSQEIKNNPNQYFIVANKILTEMSIMTISEIRKAIEIGKKITESEFIENKTFQKNAKKYFGTLHKKIDTIKLDQKRKEELLSSIPTAFKAVQE